ncbi:conjugal transfer protein TraF [Xanthomonas hortorum]|uniref:Conjugal transfer protein TraF n=1 Tax=Xanthomonas hortorum pv. hederae TaxID=453603 RepID=A0A9X4BQ49_9XANT|nr:conjugal transfer protein TraF [Xanthomonas hortorum]MCE4369658.1 conjugal transfer protein TraF [Xanthomonas hortorum pv. hederae]MDC8637156.1 conjugal transfer protein TraF [Xanthomonas hortorum pv. hederae]PPU86201.1 conjugal transfer protein TraF [Xanthomonas hortorum pv. hederae]PUF01264.1 conjugal transfer protein TraF [Xanthomonas hortorum pv. hederae]
MTRCLALLLLLPFAVDWPTAAAQTPDDGPLYWSDSWRGWHFYERPPPEPDAVEPATVPTAPTKPDALREFERLQKAVEDTRNIAIMRPTEENVRRYMALEAQVVARASYFADVAQRVAWIHPELDPTLQGRPVNARALEVYERQQAEARSHTVARLGQDHVLLFFFRSDCPYCHAFAPTLEAFQGRHGLQILAISVDGGPIPGFPHARHDNGIAKTLRVEQVPAVFLAQPFTGRIMPIGFGVLSESELLERITTLTGPDSERMLPGLGQFTQLQ